MPDAFEMPIWAIFGISAVAAYFLGCFNGAVIVSKYILRDDVRTHGSGNAGLTNFYRTFGGPLTAVVILTDVLKAVLAVLLSRWLMFHGFTIFLSAASTTALYDAIAKYWAGLFCLLGHMFPVMFKYKGGKGILSGGTIAIMIDWRVALVVWGGFPDPGLFDPVCVPGVLLGGVQLPLRQLGRLPQLAYPAAGHRLRRPDPVAAPGKYPPAPERHREQVPPPQEKRVETGRSWLGDEDHCTGQRRLGDGPGPAAAGQRKRRDIVVL